MLLKDLLRNSILVILLINTISASTLLYKTNLELRAKGYLNPEINASGNILIANEDALTYFTTYAMVLDGIEDKKPVVEIPWYVWIFVGYVGCEVIHR